MAQPALAQELKPALLPDQRITLSGATWADYQRILELRGERGAPRLTYSNGVLELMSPSRSHESLKSMIGCLVEAYCVEVGIDITPYGSWTLENEQALRGIEPDECYVLGDSPDPQTCDLAIEVIWTSGSIDKLDVYRALGVREVWIWKRGSIEVFALRGVGDRAEYQSVAASELIVGIDLPELLSFVDVQPMTQAVRQYLSQWRAARGR